jgi:hypothetical protein
MINFTVDILAIFIAQRMVHLNLRIKRLILSGFLGAILAVGELFVKKRVFKGILRIDSYNVSVVIVKKVDKIFTLCYNYAVRLI